MLFSVKDVVDAFEYMTNGLGRVGHGTSSHEISVIGGFDDLLYFVEGFDDISTKASYKT